LTLVLYPNSIEHLDRDLGFKSLSYGFNARALRYAKGQNADDAIFTNHRGEVIESSLANVLVWDGSTWWTPSLDSGCLPGVTRQLLIEYFGVKEKVIKSEELQEVECLALSSSLRGVQAISRFQGISYSSQGEVDRLRQDFANWRERNLNP
jgi:branched-chain amino acid aminotransferase